MLVLGSKLRAAGGDGARLIRAGSQERGVDGLELARGR